MSSAPNTDLPSITVSVTSEHSVAGGEAQLKCTSTVPGNYNDLPLFAWTRSDGAPVGDANHVLGTPANNGTHVLQVLTISPVHLLDNGEFTCTVVYQILGISQVITNHASNFLTVQSKGERLTYAHIINILLYACIFWQLIINQH